MVTRRRKICRPQNDEQQQAAQEQPQMSGQDWEKAISERDGLIAKLEQQVNNGPRLLPALVGYVLR